MKHEEQFVKQLLCSQLRRLMTITATFTIQAQNRANDIDKLFADPQLVLSINDIADNLMFIMRNSQERD